MDLSTTFMGLKLKNPVVVSSTSFTGTVEGVKKCADHGAGAVVLKSVFEEQILEDIDAQTTTDDMYFWYPEAIDEVRNISKEHGVKAYLQLITNAKKQVDIPIIASVNCTSPNEWPSFAKKIQEAGADALELNIGITPADEHEPGYKTKRYVDIIEAVKPHVTIPLGIKIGPYFSNIPHTVKTLCGTGLSAVVLFNRYYRPDIDINNLTLISNRTFSAPEELTQSLRWVALLSKKVGCDLAASTGIHDYTGVVKQLLAGAKVTYICTTLHKNGIDYVGIILDELQRWMERHNFASVDDFRGYIGNRVELTSAFARVQYMKKTLGEFY